MEEYITTLIAFTEGRPCQNIIDYSIPLAYYDFLSKNKYMEDITAPKLYRQLGPFLSENNLFLDIFPRGSSAWENNMHSLLFFISKETNVEQKKLLLPIIFLLDKNYVFTNYLIRIGFFADLKEFLLLWLKKIEICLSCPAAIPDYDWQVQCKKSYDIGINNCDIKKIYCFIEAVEYGNKINTHNTFVNFSIRILNDIALDELIMLIDNKNDIFVFIVFLQDATVSMKLSLALKSNNNLFKFEILRVVAQMKENISTEDVSSLVMIMSQLFNDHILWTQMIDFYTERPQLYPRYWQTLILLIADLDIDKRQYLYEHITIDPFINTDLKKLYGDFVFQIKEDTIRKEAIKYFFNRWVNFIDNARAVSMIRTNLIDIVISHVVSLDYEQIKDEIEKLLENIFELDNSQWYSDTISQTYSFYRMISKLFVYGIAAKKNGYIIFIEKMKSICQNSIYLKKELENDETTFKMFHEHIFLNTNAERVFHETHI